MKKIDFDDKDLAMIGIIILALPLICGMVYKGEYAVAASVLGTATTGLGSLAVGRKNGLNNIPDNNPGADPPNE